MHHFPVPYIDFLLRCVCYINLQSCKTSAVDCMLHGLSRGLAILLKCAYISSSQPRWEMKWILICSGSRDARWTSHVRHGGYKRCQEERKNWGIFSQSVLQRECLGGIWELQFT